MSVITFRIPDILKKRMNGVKINWSEYIRHAISDVLESDTKKTFLQKIQTLRSQTHAPRGTAARIIREMRDHA